MIVKAQLKAYEELEFAITISAPVGHWRKVLKQLEQLPVAYDRQIEWPLADVKECIERMLKDLDRTHSDVLPTKTVKLP